MDCTQAIRGLWRYLDHEIDVLSSSRIEQHLAECRECFSHAEFERRLRSLVRRACASERITPALHQRLTRLLQSFDAPPLEPHRGRRPCF
jgi:mycothiol system anti-sigma-R factor